MDIKFINYTGCYPNLCSGILTLEVDGVQYTFGNKDGCDFSKFWCTGGSVSFDDDWNEEVEEAPWEMACFSSDLETIRNTFHNDKAVEKFLEVMNDNVEYGCCGGCV